MKKFFSIIYDSTTILSTYLVLMAALSIFTDYPFNITSPLEALRAFPWPLNVQYSLLAPIALTILLLILNPFRTKENPYGGAHWSSEDEIKKMGLRDKKGLILGKLAGKYIRTNDPLSILVYAPPGSGKTAGIIIPSLLSCGNSAIVHDPKGELLEKTGPRRAAFSKVIKFSPGERISARWNPLSKKELPENWDDIQVHIDRISSSLFSAEKEKEDSMWIREAKSIFNFWALYLIHTNGETSFPKILENSLASGDPQETIADSMEAISNLPNRLQTEGNSLLAKAEKEFAGVLGTYKSKMSVFLDARVAKNLNDSDFNLKQLRKETTTIYLTVKNTDQTRLAPVLSLFFEIATLAYLHQEPTPQQKSVTLFLDEFVRLAKMKEVLHMPAIGRSYRLNAIFVCQSISQIVDIYGKTGADQMKNTCSYHVYFAQNEQKVAEDISKSIGNKTRKKKSSSYNRNQLFKNSSESEEGVPLILPQEIMSLKFGRVLICKQNHFETPTDSQTALWFKDSTMKRLIPKRKVDFEMINGPVDKEKKIEVIDVEKIKAYLKSYIPPEPVPIIESKEIEVLNGEDFNLNSDHLNLFTKILDETEEKTEEDHPVGVCSDCGRGTLWNEQIGEECLMIKEDTTICKGKYKAVKL